jgi:Fe-S cluster assembly ATPase SufC
VVTHYQRLLDLYSAGAYVMALADGRIVKSGDKSLALGWSQRRATAGWKAETA